MRGAQTAILFGLTVFVWLGALPTEPTVAAAFASAAANFAAIGQNVYF